ncbi:hypothetical protein ACLKA7_004740 [Drosophila subpalustris]
MLTSVIDKSLDTQHLGTNRTELEQQKKCVLDKDVDDESSRADIQVLRSDIQSLRAELEQQKKYILEKEADIQSLRAELERQGKLLEGLAKESDQLNSTSSLRNCVGAKSSGIYDILVPKFSNQTFKVACDAQTHNGGWTIILRRMDGSVNFTRNWTEYKNGFGDLDGEYFLGLDKIHAMTEERRQELLVLVEDFEGEQRYEIYDEFAIGNEDQQYELHTLGKANGTAGDSLEYQQGMKFSTFDRDNDGLEELNCAILSTGAWWHNAELYCHFSQLTGTYKDNRHVKGIKWDTFRGWEYSLKTAIMMIRPIK